MATTTMAVKDAVRARAAAVAVMNAAMVMAVLTAVTAALREMSLAMWRW